MEILLTITSKTDASVREVKREIGDGLVIGRGAEEGILLDGPDLSREHLVITAQGTNLFITDLSSNGTWLNGNRLRKSLPTRLQLEDSIEVPGYVLVLSPVERPQDTGEVSAGHLSQTPVVAPAAPAAVTKASGPLAMLDPVFQFIGSFSFMEKFLVVVGVTGLLLLFTYFGS